MQENAALLAGDEDGHRAGMNMMSQLGRDIAKLLSERGHVFVGERMPVRVESLRQQSAAMFASLRSDSRTYKVVVKAIPPDAIIDSPEELVRIHNRIRELDGKLAEALPRFLGAVEDRGLTVMEHVDGATLESLLESSILGARRTQVIQALAATGIILSRFHRWSASDLGVPCSPQPNRSYVEGIASLWERSPLSRFGRTPAGLDDLVALLSPGFFDREGDRLMPYDGQPKNVIVAPSGEIRLVDLDYLGGSPAISVAAFLGSLDRIALRFPDPLGWRANNLWKRVLLDAYCGHAGREVLDDLVFFYPWTLLQQHDSLVANHPRLRWYLTRHYGRRIAAFTQCATKGAASNGQRSPELLFPSNP